MTTYHSTKHPGIFYSMEAPEQWSLYQQTEAGPVPIGDKYKTAFELLEDLANQIKTKP